MNYSLAAAGVWGRGVRVARRVERAGVGREGSRQSQGAWARCCRAGLAEGRVAVRQAG